MYARMAAYDYEGLKKLHHNRLDRKIGNNTWSHLDDETGTITVSYHGHSIFRFYPDGSKSFTLAGWPTVTTRARINQFLGARGVVFQRNHTQFFDGEVISENEWISV